ncbi:hypothetical protein BDF20DRAFT_863349 [Mycotypha africana]|uniref:uncharacterized protein n=1 Tax=Mycotypha africana TaxID=64632 RepID=UPI0023017B30|nr:uncharacterized protein BDF20DRAFT_863349 [Mycotypha africana]KAI8981808.1 hypothetical protein BDF20DRAFT_863349 [Mycotypha africana]
MMFRATIVFSVVCAMTAAFVSAAPFFEHHEEHRHNDHRNDHHNDHHKKPHGVNTGGDAGLININPGKHLLIDDIKVDHSLNHVIDLDIIKLEEVLKNVDILSGNGAHHEDGRHDDIHHEDVHRVDYYEEDDHNDDHHDDEDC